MTGSNIHECKNAKSKLVSDTMPIMKMKKEKESEREMQVHPGLVQPSPRKVGVKKKLKELWPTSISTSALNKLHPLFNQVPKGAS